MLGIESPAYLTWLSLVNYDEARAMMHTGTYPALEFLDLDEYPAARWVVVTVALGMAWQAIAAFLLTRSAYRVFDEAVGRPMRKARVESVRVVDVVPECELVA